MSAAVKRGTGLRGRILITVGATTILIMMLMSWGILYRWRQGQIHREEVDALAVGRAFSVAVIDALVNAQEGFEQPESVLDRYVDLFMTQNERLRAITILDPQGNVVARSWGTRYDRWLAGDHADLASIQGPRAIVDRLNEEGWVLEASIPMHSGAHRWGVLILTFEAESIRARIAQGFFLLLLFSTAVTSVLLLLLWVLLGRVLGSLRALVTAMGEVDFERGFVPPLPWRADEIGLLHRGFHRMGKRLQQSRRDLVRAEKQVWHAERLAAIGRLAAGLAHEINNPINGVRNCIYAIQADPENRQQTTEYLEMMNEGLDHVSTVISKLLGFARKQAAELAPVPLNEPVQSVLNLSRLELGRRQVVVEADLADDLPLVMGDRQLLQEVVMNLVLNAGDAVEDGGWIRLRTEAVGDEVVLEVQDGGHGIDEKLRDQVFDPFFTTKEPGQGTGLGLSISLGIVQAHGGAMRVSSEPGAGATFTILLPVAGDGIIEDTV